MSELTKYYFRVFRIEHTGEFTQFDELEVVHRHELFQTQTRTFPGVSFADLRQEIGKWYKELQLQYFPGHALLLGSGIYLDDGLHIEFSLDYKED